MPRCLSTTYILVGCIIESRFLMVILDVCWSHSTFHGHISIFASRILIFFLVKSSFCAGEVTILNVFCCFPIVNAPFPDGPRPTAVSPERRWRVGVVVGKVQWTPGRDGGPGRFTMFHQIQQGLSKQTNWWFVDLRWWKPDLAGIFQLLKNYITRVYHGILHGNIVCKWGKRRYVGTYSLGMYVFLSILP